ncbi:hypothetical protein [Streptomyces sp. NBC_01353]|uniref:hypothetical protein n=1 Tax=Streptomyces sp. NBC_01353 TaxID=2903835 RepID=UPI002E372EB5|nr:hypothetical protein [Streptomyces sp. NBC_01353]
MTTPPDTPTVDQALTGVCLTSGEHLAGLIAHGMLEVVGQPEKLPTLLFPDLDPDAVMRVWNTALPVGFNAARLAANPRWTPGALRRLKAALNDAGYEAMGDLAGRSARTLDPHPADTEPVREHP